MDSLNGPIGIFVAGASGVLRIIYVSPDNTPDLVPVDFACNSFIAAASYIGQQTERKLNESFDKMLMNTTNGASGIVEDEDSDKQIDTVEESEQIAEVCPVFNCTVSAQAAVSWRELIAVGLEVFIKVHMVIVI